MALLRFNSTSIAPGLNISAIEQTCSPFGLYQPLSSTSSSTPNLDPLDPLDPLVSTFRLAAIRLLMQKDKLFSLRE